MSFVSIRFDSTRRALALALPLSGRSRATNRHKGVSSDRNRKSSPSSFLRTTTNPSSDPLLISFPGLQLPHPNPPLHPPSQTINTKCPTPNPTISQSRSQPPPPPSLLYLPLPPPPPPPLLPTSANASTATCSPKLGSLGKNA